MEFRKTILFGQNDGAEINGVVSFGSVLQDSLSEQCGGSQISTSYGCEPGQFCCFSIGGIPPTSTPSPTTTAAPTTTSAPTTTTTTPPPTTVTTTTTTPSTTTTSVTTANMTSPASSSSSPSSSNNKTCTPENAAAPGTQGRCTAESALTTACDGLQIAASLDCGVYEFCCYTPLPIVPPPMANAGFCVPDSAPTVMNGACVANPDLTGQCAGKELSTSGNCDVTQLCCFVRGSGGGSTPASTSSTVTTTSGGGGSDSATTSYSASAAGRNGDEGSVQLPVSVDDGRMEANVRGAASSYVGIQVPNNWPRFL